MKTFSFIFYQALETDFQCLQKNHPVSFFLSYKQSDRSQNISDLAAHFLASV